MDRDRRGVHGQRVSVFRSPLFKPKISHKENKLPQNAKAVIEKVTRLAIPINLLVAVK